MFHYALALKVKSRKKKHQGNQVKWDILGYLGDGIPHLPEDLGISFGTDCNNRICLVEEMRWACYSQQVIST